MGVFDYIRCRMPLPSEPPPPAVEWFQTKDVPTYQLYLEKWTIEADGRLIKHGVRYEDRSDPNAEPGSFERIVGLLTPVPMPEADEAVDFHGDIVFYNREYTYVARFTEGRCVRIWCEEYESSAPVPPQDSGNE